MTYVICDCALAKHETRNGYYACEHCDQPCGIKNCKLCDEYKRSVNARINKAA